MSPWYPALQHVALEPLALGPMLYQVYNPEALRVKLDSGPTVDRRLEEMEGAVRAACGTEGRHLCREIVASTQRRERAVRQEEAHVSARRGKPEGVPPE